MSSRQCAPNGPRPHPTPPHPLPHPNLASPPGARPHLDRLKQLPLGRGYGRQLPAGRDEGRGRAEEAREEGKGGKGGGRNSVDGCPWLAAAAPDVCAGEGGARWGKRQGAAPDRLQLQPPPAAQAAPVAGSQCGHKAPVPAQPPATQQQPCDRPPGPLTRRAARRKPPAQPLRHPPRLRRRLPYAAAARSPAQSGRWRRRCVACRGPRPSARRRACVPARTRACAQSQGQWSCLAGPALC